MVLFFAIFAIVILILVALVVVGCIKGVYGNPEKANMEDSLDRCDAGKSCCKGPT